MKTLSPEDLKDLPESDFRRIVDDAVRGIGDEALLHMLRHPSVVERWYQTLVLTKKNVEGQLAAKKADYDAKHLDGKTPPDELRKLRAAHERWRASAIRFKTGVESQLHEARALRLAICPPEPGLIGERNYYIEQCRKLRRAIADHREHRCDDGCTDDYCRADSELWAQID